ncbi:pectin lyase fold/virulence factor [Pyrenochaeta sp. MPI-SDFR-AT-0127]|nr:pectin lyase fold/virulence factor [Pyrenochaeta sp. MPI-SDFR-AT-0127]
MSHHNYTLFVITTPSRDDDCKRVYPGSSIQEAIDHARPGDRIEVEPGTYHEQLTIKTNGIQLIGKEGVILKPPIKFNKNLCSGLSQSFDKKETEAGICIHGRHIKLEPYVAEHRKIKSVRRFIKNVSVTGFTVSGFDGENIAVVGGQNVKVSKNTLIDGGQYGFLSVGCKGTRAAGNVVSTTAINFIAMCMDDYSDAVLSENEITGYFTGLVALTPNGLITNNKANNVCVGSAADPGVHGAIIINNHFTLRNPGCNVLYQIYGAGIVVFGAAETIVKQNTIEKFNNNGTGVGIFLLNGPGGEVATRNVIRENTLRGNDFDIYDNSTGVNDLANNACTSNAFPPAACA